MTVVEDDTYVIHGPEPAEPLPTTTLGEEIFESLLAKAPSPNHVAMVDAFTGKTLSYKCLLEESCNLAEALRAYGCSANTTVSICSENNLEFFIPVVASLYIGSIVATINHNYTETELKHTLNISKPKIVFCSEAAAPKFIKLKGNLQYLDKVVVIDTSRTTAGAENLKQFVNEALRGSSVLPDKFQPYTGDPASLGAFILCSSGTTGLPKGVLLSHLNLMVKILQARDPRYRLDHVESILGLMPFFHGYGLSVGIGSIIRRRKIIVFKKFEEDAFLKAIQDHQITILALAPPLAIFLEKTPKLAKYDLSCVREIVCGAAPLSASTEIALKKRLKNVRGVRQAYGLTEATVGVIMPDPNVIKPGSCGKVLTYMSCKVRDPETGKSLGPNQVGEMCFKGPLVMVGYYNDEKTTRESFTSDGWLKTGDLGYYDSEGFFYIVDRLKELIKYKGFQVAPAELEAILVDHPKVRDVGVVGLPDDLAGELPLAFVVKTDGADVTEKELQDYVASKVSPQKRLRGGVIFVPQIPKNPSGKILRRELRQKLKGYKRVQQSKL